MILPDTSAWIDYFNDRPTPAAVRLDQALDSPRAVAVGDLVLLEVLQGLKDARSLRRVGGFLGGLQQVDLCGRDIAVKSAANYRLLRRQGITIRGTIDVVIATWCIENGAEIIHNDRDMALMEDALGLVSYR